jgi:hypothetical protein
MAYLLGGLELTTVTLTLAKTTSGSLGGDQFPCNSRHARLSALPEETDLSHHGWRMEGGRENGAGRGVRISGSAGELCGSTDVSMVKATDFGNLKDPAELRSLDRPCVGCIFVEREVSARPVIVREVARQDATQVAFAQDEDVIQALEPLRRSTKGFCHGLQGAVRISAIPMPFTRCRNA